MGRFVLRTAADGQTYFNLKAGNGETILTSEMYHAKTSALAGIESVRTNAPLNERYERRASASSNHVYFVLKAGNHEVIGTSEMYDTEAGIAGGMLAVKQNAPSAEIDDQPQG